MSEFWSQYVDCIKESFSGMYLIYLIVISLCIATFYVYLPSASNKSKFDILLKTGLCFVGFVVSSILANGLISVVLPNLRYMLTFFLACLWCSVALEWKLTKAMVCVVSGFATQNLIFALLQLLYCLVGLKFNNYLYLGVTVVICVAMFFVFVRKMKNIHNVLVINEVWIASVVLLFVITEMGKARSDDAVTNLVLILTQIAIDLFIVIYVISAVKSQEKQAEMREVKRFIAVNNDIQAKSQRYVDFINFKCHDLKQYVNFCREANMISGEVADSILQSISEVYQKAGTGNEVLDAILADKVIVCKQRDIKFECHVTTSEFDVLPQDDLTTVFNNVIYNAIEYVSKFENEKDKMIDLKVFTRNKFLCITCRNYCYEPPKVENGLPLSTKSEENHGLGLKSVKYVAEKHGGSINVSIDGLFFVATVLIPL